MHPAMAFRSNPRRDAKRSFAGYVYQINVTIFRWLFLKPDEHLELEAGEDIDAVRGGLNASDSQKSRLMEQLKQLKKSITLRSPDALEAIANFCQHKSDNPTENLQFRFLTTASVSKERRPWAASLAGIKEWEYLRVNSGDDEHRTERLEALRKYLRTCKKPDDLSLAVWQKLKDVLAATDIAPFEELVNGFEWATDSGDHQVVEKAICDELQKRNSYDSEGAAKVQYRNLFGFVIKLLAQDTGKQLTAELLSSEFAATSLTLEDQLAAMQFRSWIDAVNAKLTEHEARIDALEDQKGSGRLQSFVPLSQAAVPSGLLFDFNQTLRGRKRRLEDLNQFMADPQARIAILPGRGGIGKTKLLRDWASNLRGSITLWLNPYGNWSGQSGGEVPNTETVIIADDAHRYSDLEKLISYVSSETEKTKLKLIVATRPSGFTFVNDVIARASDEVLVKRFDTLREPGPNATLEIAKEVLGADCEHLAEALTRVSADTPLVTVVGGRLIARQQIRPELLANDEDFRRAVFQKFAEECEGSLPTGRAQRRELLQVIAAVQPVVDQDERFADRASAFLAIRPDQIWQGLDDLEQRGVLLRGRGGVRITPDLFGDFLLESASVNSQGNPTGFADAVFQWFEESHLANLLKNFAELDWRITQRDPDSQLLNQIWEAIYKRFKTQNAAQRSHFLREIKDIAGFQPERVEELVRIAMDEPAEPGTERFLSRPREQKDVLETLPPILETTIFHEPTSEDSFSRLWKLSHDVSNVHTAARKSLKEAIGYHKYKDLTYNERILKLVEKTASEPESFIDDFTPLAMANELLEREIEDNRLRGRTFSISFLPLNYPAIRKLRDRALEVIEHTLYSNIRKAAVEAARSCARVISEFHPRLRSGPTEEENAWQDQERLKALDIIERRIAAGGLSLPLVWKLGRILSNVDRRDAQSPQIKERANAILHSLPQPEQLDFFDFLATDEYEDGIIESSHVTVPQSRRDQEERVLLALRTGYPNQVDRIKALEELVNESVAAGIEPVSLGNLLQRLCQETGFLKAVTQHSLDNPNAILARLVQIPLSLWRDVEPGEFGRLGRLFAASHNFLLAAGAAIAVCYGPAIDTPIPEDAEILAVLSKRTEGRVLGPVLFGLKRLAMNSTYRTSALQMYAEMKVGIDHFLAKEYCGFAGTYGIPSDILTPAIIGRALNNLVDVEELDRDAFGGFLAKNCHIAPLAFVEFFRRRILLRLSLGDVNQYSSYEAIPSSFSWSSLRGKVDGDTYAAAVGALLQLIRQYPRFNYNLTSVFWHIASIDTVTMSALDSILHESEDSGPSFVCKMLREGPKGIVFSHPMFAMHVLMECSNRSSDLETNARSTLFANSLYGAGMQVSAGPPRTEQDESHVNPAAALSATWPEGSIPHRFYLELSGARRAVVAPPDFLSPDDEDDDVDLSA
jgi:hypothetical protein